MSLQFSNRKLSLFREQTSENTDAVESALDSGSALVYQDVADMSWDLDAHNDPPERETWSASGHKAPFIKNMASVDIELPLTAGDGSTAQPFYHMLLKAMNLTEDTSTSNVAVYSPSTRRVSMATLYQYIRNVENGNSRLRYMTDFVGSGEINISTGEEATMSITGSGYYSSITTDRDYVDSSGNVQLLKDGSSPTSTPSFSLADKAPLIPKNMTVTFNGPQFGSAQTFHISEFTLDMNWTQDSTDALTNSEGQMNHYNTRGTTDRTQGGFTLVESTPSNFDNLISSYEAADEMTLNVDLINVGNTSERIEIDIPKAQLGVESEGENGNLMNHEFEFGCDRDTSNLSGDNDFKITYKT